MKITVNDFNKCKSKKEKIAMLTAYGYSTAKIMDEAGVDSVLVGDSLGMVVLGYPDTLSVTMNDMLRHTSAVARAVKRALIVADLPYDTYNTPAQALANAKLLVEAGAEAVKLEGGAEIAQQVRAVVEAGIPVIGHLGYTPQSVKKLGKFAVQGKDETSARKILEDAKAVEKAGAFSVVLECVPEELAAVVTDSLSIATIGIGAGKHCDGQVLVFQDMLAMYNDFKPKFVKQFADVGGLMKQAFQAYIEETKKGVFPSEAQSYTSAKLKGVKL